MSEASFVEYVLSSYTRSTEIDGYIAVPTHCLYPSNKAVTVYVTGGPTGSRVSDEGGALDELSAHGRSISDPDRFLARFCRVGGLLASGGKISSIPVPMEGLAAAVVLVANASSAAARWGLDHSPALRRRDLRQEVYAVLTRHFPKEKIASQARLTGKSSRQYHFDHVVQFDDRKLIVDSVLPDANSVNSRAIAHFDVSQMEDLRLIQRIVYDDEEPWDAADLNLLQMAAPLVSISRFGQKLNSITTA